VGSPLSFYLSCKSAPDHDGWVWAHNLHEWLRLRFWGGHKVRADITGEHRQKLNLVSILKDKEVIHKAGILEFWGNGDLK
jgi:hypothetical protein